MPSTDSVQPSLKTIERFFTQSHPSEQTKGQWREQFNPLVTDFDAIMKPSFSTEKASLDTISDAQTRLSAIENLDSFRYGKSDEVSKALETLYSVLVTTQASVCQ
jgi:hypothetical protein